MNIRRLMTPKRRRPFAMSFLDSVRDSRSDVATGMNSPVRTARAEHFEIPHAEPRLGESPSFVSPLESAAAVTAKDEPRVKDIMTTDVKSCRPDRTLLSAAVAMHRGDCRSLPVVDEAGRPVAVITDGDICEIGATDPRPLRDILVSEAMSCEVFTCRPEDDIRHVLGTMKRNRVRHLPVVDQEGRMVGVVSLTDVILRVEENETGILAPLHREIAAVLRVLSQKERGPRTVRINPFRED
jgi:CBS domain-containing protein